MKKFYFFLAIFSISFLSLKAVVFLPDNAPITPTAQESDVMALFCPKYTTNNLNFETKNDELKEQWYGHKYSSGDSVLIIYKMKWDMFAKSDWASCDLHAYKKFNIDIYDTIVGSIKITFESADGTNKYKKGTVVNLSANTWNHIEIDLLGEDFADYNFSNLKCIILESFMKSDNTSAEGTPLAVANMYFSEKIEGTDVADMRPFKAVATPDSLTQGLVSKIIENSLAFTPQPTMTETNLDDTLIYHTDFLNNDGVVFSNGDKKIDVAEEGYRNYTMHFDIFVEDTIKAAISLCVGIDGSDTTLMVTDSLNLNKGWNTIDKQVNTWPKPELNGDAKDIAAVKGFAINLATVRSRALGITNVYCKKETLPVFPIDAPTLPTYSENDIIALNCAKYHNKNLNFEPKSWGATWDTMTYANGTKVFYTEKFGWEAFTNEDTTKYDVSEYPILHVDIYSTIENSKIKLTFEQGKNIGDEYIAKKLSTNNKTLKKGWNAIEVMLTAEISGYDFKDLRYFIVEGFSDEGTPLGVANIYCRTKNAKTSISNIQTKEKPIRKYVSDGQLIIERGNKKYNAQGNEL